MIYFPKFTPPTFHLQIKNTQTSLQEDKSTADHIF